MNTENARYSVRSLTLCCSASVQIMYVTFSPASLRLRYSRYMSRYSMSLMSTPLRSRVSINGRHRQTASNTFMLHLFSTTTWVAVVRLVCGFEDSTSIFISFVPYLKNRNFLGIRCAIAVIVSLVCMSAV